MTCRTEELKGKDVKALSRLKNHACSSGEGSVDAMELWRAVKKAVEIVVWTKRYSLSAVSVSTSGARLVKLKSRSRAREALMEGNKAKRALSGSGVWGGREPMRVAN